MENKEMQKVTILKAFRDKDNFAKAYIADEEVEFTKERAEHLKRLGLVDFGDGDVTGDVTGGILTKDDVTGDVTIDLTANHQTVVSAVKKCESIEELEKALIAETNDKNRTSVIEALQAQLTKLQPVQ